MMREVNREQPQKPGVTFFCLCINGERNNLNIFKTRREFTFYLCISKKMVKDIWTILRLFSNRENAGCFRILTKSGQSQKIFFFTTFYRTHSKKENIRMSETQIQAELSVLLSSNDSSFSWAISYDDHAFVIFTGTKDIQRTLAFLRFVWWKDEIELQVFLLGTPKM